MRQMQAMQQDQAAGGLTFPIKLRCTSLADLLAEPGLEAALARLLGRSLANACSMLPSSLSRGGGVALQPPYMADAGGLTKDQSSTLLKSIGRAIQSAARVQLLSLAAPRQVASSAHSHSTRVAATAQIRERFDRSRFDAASGAYRMPSYQGGEAEFPIEPTPDPEPASGTTSGSATGPSLDQIIRMIKESFPHNDGLPDSDGTHYGIYVTAEGQVYPKLYFLVAGGRLKEMLYFREQDGHRSAIELFPGSYRIINTSGQLEGELYRRGRLVGRPRNVDNLDLTVVFVVPEQRAAAGVTEVHARDPRLVLRPQVTLLRLSAEDMTTGSEGSYLAGVTIWRRGNDGKEFALYPLAWVYAQLEYGWDIWRWEPLPDGGKQRVQELSIPLGQGRAFLDYTWKQEGTYDIQCTVRLRDKEASLRPITDLRRDKVIKLEIKQAIMLAGLEQQEASGGQNGSPIWTKSARDLIDQYEKKLKAETNLALRRALEDAIAKLRRQLLQPVQAGPFPIHAIFTDRRTSQTRPLALFLAPEANEDPVPLSVSGKPVFTWLLIDVTYPAFNATYRGSGETHGEAIRAAFETSRTSFQNKYPPGQILASIDWPQMKAYGLSRWTFPIETESWQREAFEWLTLGVQALGAITLAASIVFPPSAIVTGAIVVTMVVGATLSAVSLASRVSANNFEWDAQAIADIINIAASFALVAGTVSRGVASGISRSLASAEAVSLDAQGVAALAGKAAKLAKFSRAMLWMGLGGDVSNGVLITVDTYKELRDVDAAMGEGVLADYERIYGKEEGHRRWEQERFVRILGTLARAAINGVLIAVSISGARKGLGEVHAPGALAHPEPNVPAAQQKAATAQDYLVALRDERLPQPGAGRGWDHARFPKAPEGARWQPGDPIDMPSSAGGYPTAETARTRYWKNRAHFELEARKRSQVTRDADSQDPFRRLSEAELEGIRTTGGPPPAPAGQVIKLESAGVPQRVNDWLVALGFSREEARRLLEVSNPAALLEIQSPVAAQGAGQTPTQASGGVVDDIRAQRPLAAMSDATITEIMQKARDKNFDFNANGQTKRLRDALRSEINVRGLPVSPPSAAPPPAGAPAEPPPPPENAAKLVKQGSQIPAPAVRLAKAAEVERIKNGIIAENNKVALSEARIMTLNERRAKLLQAKPIPRPAELRQNPEFNRLMREGTLQQKLEAVGRLERNPNLSPESREHLKQVREFLTTVDARDKAIQERDDAKAMRSRLEGVDLPRAEAELRTASLAIKDFLRKVGPNYSRISSNVSHDQVMGRSKWDTLVAELPKDAPRPALATDHLVALDRIANMQELSDFLVAYEKASPSVRQKMMDELVSLGDIEQNLRRMRGDANGFKSNKSWNDITYDEVKKFGYSNADVDAARIAEGKALDIIKKRIAEMTARYK